MNYFKVTTSRLLFQKLIRKFGTRPTTVDANEITHLSNQAFDWWNLDGKLMGLHAYNKLRVPFIRDNLIYYKNIPSSQQKSSQPLTGIEILEVGCGGGILCEPLAKIGAKVTGVDASEELIDLAISHANQDPEIVPRLQYIYSTIEDYAEKNPGRFDAVVLSEVVEHVTQKRLFLEYCLAAVKPGGSVFITTESKTPLSWLTVIFLSENIFKIIPKGTHQYEKFITPDELGNILEPLGCKVQMTQGTLFNPFNATWAWTSCDKVCYVMHAIKNK